MPVKYSNRLILLSSQYVYQWRNYIITVDEYYNNGCRADVHYVVKSEDEYHQPVDVPREVQQILRLYHPGLELYF